MARKQRNLKDMLAEAKNTSEIMVDLAYAAIFYDSEDISEEVFRLEAVLNELVYDMRTLAILAARSPADAEQMAGILQVVQDIEKIGNAAYDIAKIVVKNLGIPPELLHDIPEAEEIPARVRIHFGSELDGRSLEEVDLAVETGMRPIAIRSKQDWHYHPKDDHILRDGDVMFLQGPPEGVAELRRLAGARPMQRVPGADDLGGPLSELERAVDIIIEMKNTSEVAVGLAYSALLYDDAGLAREVVAIEGEMDDMRYRLEHWVLLAAKHVEDAGRLRGMLHLAIASETIADCAKEMVWMIERGDDVHPVLSAAVGESDELVVKVNVAPGSPADGKTIVELSLETETGMFPLAVNRGGRWTYRPRDNYVLLGDDALLFTGAPEGFEVLSGIFGQVFDSERD